ncbi:MAG TPA: hypothetical protein VGQ33_22865 [Vicinamibacteria bacterium]|nr:hypothetical protein [Vicinamibacteria bacterium]
MLLLSLSLARPASPAPPVPPAESVQIVSEDVQCVLSGRHPQLQACFKPDERVGRAQVQFRGDESGPWYSVDMTADGACRTAVLPKPTRQIASIHYFIEVVDRVSGLVRRPSTAPLEPFAPRVVESASACGAGQRVAPSVARAEVVVGLARDAEGRPLPPTEVRAAEANAPIAGFSHDGVTMESTGTRPGTAGRARAGGDAGGTGVSEKGLVIAGGLLTAGALAAVIAAGNKSDGSTTDPGTTNPLTGHWLGTVDSGAGLTLLVNTADMACTYRWDLTSDLVQSGASLSGSATAVSRSANCSFQAVPTLPAPFAASASSVPINGAASGGSVTFQAGINTLTGTYTASLLDAAGSVPGVASGATATYTWRQTKQQ